MIDTERLREQLKYHAPESAPAPENNGQARLGINESPDRLKAYLESRGVGVKTTKSDADGSTIFLLETCPVNPDHGGDSGTAVMFRANGRIGFKCHHNRCTSTTWKQVRAKIDPDYASNNGKTPRRVPTPSAAEVKNIIKQAKETGDGAAVFDHVAILARLPWDQYAKTKQALKNACGKSLNLNDFDRAVKELRRQERQRDSVGAGQRCEAAAGPYRATDRGLIYMKATHDGDVPVPLTNYTAKIVGETVVDDGAETRRELDIEARLGGRTYQFTIPANAFAGLVWVVENIGPEAVNYAGFGTKDHARVAIQLLSDHIPKRHIYAHSGWRKVGASWCYLHADGAIPGPVGAEVRLPDALAHFRLPDPPTDDVLREAVHASLRLLSLGPDRIAIPLHAATFRAALGSVDFSVHLAGSTGVFKTELAALAQQHFGPGFDARHLPGSWNSTVNANETLTHAAKDAVLVVDDFAPTGTASDVARLHREADRLLRGAGNRQGRARLRSDCSLRPTRNPRCLIVTTGEDVPRGQSLRARLVIIEVRPNDVDVDMLTRCQGDAASGLYAQAMAAFIGWLAPRYETIRSELPKRIAELRASLAASHRRTPTTIANLVYGFELFLRFGAEVGAIADAEAARLRDRADAAFRAIADAQADHLRASDPVGRFQELVSAALASGHAHVAATDGGQPHQPEGWGWREKTLGTGNYQRTEWQPQGDRIGWVTADGDLYLEPSVAFRTAQAMAGPSGESIAVTERTLWERLKERGLIRVGERGRSTVQRRLEGRKRRVVWLNQALSPAPAAGKPGTAGTGATHGVENDDSVPDAPPPSPDIGDTNGDARGQERGLPPVSPESPLGVGETDFGMPAGCTPEQWAARIRRAADQHPDRADDLRERAAIIELEAEQERDARAKTQAGPFEGVVE